MVAFELLGSSVMPWQLMLTLGTVFCVAELLVHKRRALPIALGFFAAALLSTFFGSWLGQLVALCLGLSAVMVIFQVVRSQQGRTQ